jgi:RNA polymerase sigma-70 factor (ECF subfamily)
VAHALDTLPDRARQVVELTFYSQLSQTEIAERLDLPLGTVKSDVRRALQRLRPHLEGGEIRA